MNVVADALSRIPAVNQINSLSIATHSDDSSGQNLILSVDTPINCFKNQIILCTHPIAQYKFEIIFPHYHRHHIFEPEFTQNKLVNILKKYLYPSILNAIKTSEENMGKIQEIYSQHFNKYRIRFSRHQVKDIRNEEEQNKIIIDTHNRAHRNSKENRQQILEEYYFPAMSNKIKKIIKQCGTCKENKYDRHPIKPMLKETPIPKYPGEIIHIDIYKTEGNLVLTAIDKFSKYAQAKAIKSKATEDIRQPLREIIFAFGVPKTIVMDNEKSFNSSTITFMIKNQLNIEVFTVPPYSSKVNGQIERFHSTLSEIMRCTKVENIHNTFKELLEISV